MTENLLKPGERLDDLQRNGLHIIQHPRAFRFGMDAVLLADFTRLRPRERAADMRAAYELIGRESMHAAVCNPPYGKRGGTLTNEAAPLLLARHETDCTIQDVTAACAAVLRTHGRLSMVFPAARLLELLDAMRQSRLEPKRIRLVCARVDRAPYLALVEAMKNAKPGLLWMPTLIVYRQDGSETDELRRIYHQA